MKYLSLTIVCLFAFQLSYGKTYKVKTAEEFNKAAASVAPGDEIVITNGSYTGWSVAINANGTADNPIIIKAENSGKAMFTGDVHQTVLRVSGSYINIKGLKFEGCQLFKEKGGVVLVELTASKYCRMTDCTFNKNSVNAQFMPIIVVAGKSEHTRVDNCSFTNNVNNQDVQVRVGADDVSVYTLIDHNTFMNKDSVTWKGNNGGECVQIGQDPILLGNKYSYTTVRDNKFVNCNGEPEHPRHSPERRLSIRDRRRKQPISAILRATFERPPQSPGPRKNRLGCLRVPANTRGPSDLKEAQSRSSVTPH